MPESISHPDPETVELRLALVCYGGVSLAVYMHGVTKELHKLVVASRALDDARATGATTNPFCSATDPTQILDGFDSEALYFDALRRLEDAGRPLSVAIDIIGGTSAGGINGVVLAKALAINASQDALRSLWINEGDLRKLLRGPRFAGLAVQAATAAVWSVVNAWRPTSLLRSDVMSQNLVRALTTMDASTLPNPVVQSSSLIPRLRRLQLFVTTTDQSGFDVVVPSGAGGIGQRDRAYAQVMEFRSSNTDPRVQPAGFGSDDTGALAFAARATSAFPAAFAPVTRSGFLQEIKNAIPLDPKRFGEMFLFRYHTTDTEEPTQPKRSWWARLLPRGSTVEESERHFIDGGLLDNAPFDLVVDAIAREPAQHEVIRRLVYIEPDPGKPLTAAVEEYQRRSHSFADDLMAIKAPLTSHSYLGDLLHLRDMNGRIAEIGRIADLQRTEVEAVISRRVQLAAQQVVAADAASSPGVEAKPPTTFLEQLLTLESAQQVSDSFYRDAETGLSETWRTYQRMKALAIADRVTDAIISIEQLPPESLTASAIRDALSSYMRATPEWRDGGTALADKFLKPADTPYRVRRYMFIIDGINKLYGDGGPDRAAVDKLKAAVWDELTKLHDAPEEIVDSLGTRGITNASVAYAETPRPVGTDQLPAEVTELLDSFFTRYAALVDVRVGNDNDTIWATFTKTALSAVSAASRDATGALRLGDGWTDEHFRLLASRYLGFPKWDGALFPITALSRIPQLTPIPVSQFSPREAATLSDYPTPRPKLYGAKLAHFAAFLEPGYRESDYLSGRLDGADLIIRLLAETTGDDALVTDLARPTLEAIFRSEIGGLTHIPDESRRWLDEFFGD
ncbi:patatin-like protein [Gordonia sp. NPDC003376]